MATEAYKKISDKEYEIQLDGRTKTLFFPFGKIQKLLEVFAAKEGLIDANTGEVKTELMTLVSNFGELGTIALSEFDDEGKLTKEVSCKGLAYTDVINVFKMVSEIISDFMLTISQGMVPQEMEQKKAPKPKEK